MDSLLSYEVKSLLGVLGLPSNTKTTFKQIARVAEELEWEMLDSFRKSYASFRYLQHVLTVLK